MVLLKNEDENLPLSKNSRIAVIGELGQKVRYQGGGSSHIHPTQLDNPYEQMVLLAEADASVTYAEGYKLASDESDPLLMKEAVEAAKDRKSLCCSLVCLTAMNRKDMTGLTWTSPLTNRR